MDESFVTDEGSIRISFVQIFKNLFFFFVFFFSWEKYLFRSKYHPVHCIFQ